MMNCTDLRSWPEGVFARGMMNISSARAGSVSISELGAFRAC